MFRDEVRKRHWAPEKVTAKETDTCKMEPPTTQEKKKYFDDVINNYATQNVDLVEHLKRIEDRLAVMEKTAPALMVYNLFKEIKSETDLDFGEYVTQMVAQAELGIKPDLFNISQGVPEAKLSKTESDDSTTVAQIHQLESLLNEEAQIKNRIAQMVTLESETKAAMEILGTPEMAMAFEMQNKFDTGKFGKVNVPLTEASPTIIDKADKLCCTLRTIENCCACKLVKIQGLKSTVEYLSQVMRYAAKHEEDRDKPDIPEAKRTIHDLLLNDDQSTTTTASQRNVHYPNPRPKDSHTSSNPHSNISQKSKSFSPSHENESVYGVRNEKDNKKLHQSYVLDHHIVHYRVGTSTMIPFQQYQNPNNLHPISSTINPHSIESLLIRGPKTYYNKYNQQNFDDKKNQQNYDVRQDQPKDLEENYLDNNQPHSFLVTSYNTNTLDADYILYKREELSNSFEFKPEFIKFPVQTDGTKFQPHYMNQDTSEHTTTTEISSKFNILNTDDLFYSVLIPKTEPKLNEEKIMMNSTQTEPFVSESIVSSKCKDESVELSETLIESKTPENLEESSSQYTDVSQEDFKSYTVGNVVVLPKNIVEYSDIDREISIEDMQNSEFEDEEKIVPENESLDRPRSSITKKKHGKASLSKENTSTLSAQEGLTKKTAKNKRKTSKENKKESSTEVKNKSDASKNKLVNHDDVIKTTSLNSQENVRKSERNARKSEGNVRKSEGNVRKSEGNIRKSEGNVRKSVSHNISKEKIEESESESDDSKDDSFDLMGIDRDDITFIQSIVSSIIPTSPSRHSNAYAADHDVADLFLDLTDANAGPTDVISIREESTSQSTLLKHFPIANLNSIVPEITIKYYLTDKTTGPEGTEVSVEGGDKVYTKIIKPVGVDLMDTPEKFSEVIVKYNVPIPTHLLKECVTENKNQIEKYTPPEGSDEGTDKKKDEIKKIKSFEEEIDLNGEKPGTRYEQHLLWFDQFPKIELPKKSVHSDFTKIHCTCSKNCDCHDCPDTKINITKCSKNGQIDNKSLDSYASKSKEEDLTQENPTNSWFEKNSSLEIAHHSFLSDNETQCCCNSKMDTNSHALQGGNSKLPLNIDQPCKVECKSTVACTKYEHCANIACTSNFSQIVYDEKSILASKTPHNSYQMAFMDSRESNQWVERQEDQDPKRTWGPKSTIESYDTIKHTKCLKSDPNPKTMLKSKTTCDCKTSCECDASFFSNISPNLTKSCLKSKTEVPSNMCQKSNDSHFKISCKSNLATKSHPKKILNQQSLLCQEIKSNNELPLVVSNTMPDSIKPINNELNCIGKTTNCCLSFKSESKEFLTGSTTQNMESCSSDQKSANKKPICVKTCESKKPNMLSPLSDLPKVSIPQPKNESVCIVNPTVYCKAYKQNHKVSEPSTLPDSCMSKNIANDSLLVDRTSFGASKKHSICCKFNTHNNSEQNKTCGLPDSSKSKNITNESLLLDQKTPDAVKNTFVCCKSYKETFETKTLPDLSKASSHQSNLPKLPLLVAESLSKMKNKAVQKILITNPPPNTPFDQKSLDLEKKESLVRNTSTAEDLKICETKYSTKHTCNLAQSICLPSDVDSIGSYFKSNVQKIVEQFTMCKCTSENPNEKQILEVLINSLHNFSKKSLMPEKFITNIENKSITVEENISKIAKDTWDCMVDKTYNDLTTTELSLSSEEKNKINIDEKKYSEVVERNESSKAECMKIKNFMVGQIMNELNNIDQLFLMNQDGVMKIENKENNVNGFIQTLIDKFKNLNSNLPSKLLLDDENSNYHKMDSLNTTVFTERISQNNLETILNVDELETDAGIDKTGANLDYHSITENLHESNTIPKPNDVSSESKNNIEITSKEKVDSLEYSANTKMVSNQKKDSLELPTNTKTVPNQEKDSLKYPTSPNVVLNEKKDSLELPTKAETVVNDRQDSLEHPPNTKMVPNQNKDSLELSNNNKTVSNNKNDTLEQPISPNVALNKRKDSLEVPTKTKTVPNDRKENLDHPPNTKMVPNQMKISSNHPPNTKMVPNQNKDSLELSNNTKTVPNQKKDILEQPISPNLALNKRKDSLDVPTKAKTVPINRKDSLKHPLNTKTVPNEKKPSLENQTKTTISPNQTKTETVPFKTFPTLSTKKKITSNVKKAIYQVKGAAVPIKKKVVPNEKKIFRGEKKASLGQQTNNANAVTQNVVSVKNQTNVLTVSGGKVVSLENQTNNETHQKDKPKAETVPKQSEIIPEYNERMKNSINSIDIPCIKKTSSKINEGCQTNMNESFPNFKDNTTHWSHTKEQIPSAITNSEIVLNIDNKSSASTIKSHLTDIDDVLLRSSNHSKNSTRSNKKVKPSITGSKSSFNSNQSIGKLPNKISTKSNEKVVMVKSVSTTSRTSRRISNAYSSEKRNPNLGRGSSMYNPEKNITDSKPSNKHSKIFVQEVVVNQTCLLTKNINIASLRGASFNSLKCGQISAGTAPVSKFINEQISKYQIEKNKQINNMFDGLSQISTIRGSYQQEVTGLIAYYKKLLQEINNKKSKKKIIRRSQTSLCSLCAKESEEVSLCSCSSNCS